MTTPFLFSNSSAYAWHKCKRDFYHRYLHGGQGITTLGVEEDLLFGSLVHEMMPALWTGTLTSSIMNLSRSQLELAFLNDAAWEPKLTPNGRIIKAKEWGRLLIGILLAFQRGLLPFLTERYHLESAETDLARWLPAYGVKQVALIAKPDTLLTPRADFVDADLNPALPLQGLGYLEYKTVANPGERWAATFKRNPQSWTGAMTVKAARDVELEWFMVAGLVKGTETAAPTDADPFMKRRATPLCWLYRCLPGAGSGRATKADETAIITGDGTKWHWDYTNAKGWERATTDEFPGGVAGWIAALPLEIVQQQVVLTEPVTIDWALAEEWLEGQKPMIEAVRDWQMTPPHLRQGELKQLFPRELSQCESHRGPCPFLRVCHNEAVAADPVGSGFYQVRRPHHPLEVEMLKGGQ